MPVTAGNHQGLRYFVETKANGVPLSRLLSRDKRVECLIGIGSALKLLNDSTALGDPTGPRGVALRVQIEQAFATLRRYGPSSPGLDHAETILRQLASNLRIKECLSHGDFSVSNIFSGPDHQVTLIDWECDALEGIPLLDCLNYLDSVQRHIEGGKVLENMQALCEGRWACRGEIQLLDEMLVLAGLERSSISTFAALYWLRHTLVRLRSQWVYDAPGISRELGRGAMFIKKYC